MAQLAYIMIRVDDMDRAVEFYRDQMGLALGQVRPDWVEFHTGSTPLVLRPSRDSETTGAGGKRVQLAFRVDDLDARYRELRERGVQFVAEPGWGGPGRIATLLDPEGNAIDLVDGAVALASVSAETVVNEIVNRYPESMEVLEDHGIRICGGCIVLLNSPVAQTAEYSGLGSPETERLVHELNSRVQALSASPVHASV